MKHFLNGLGLLFILALAACGADAPTDAGPPDTGVVDSGAVDAGPDAGGLCSEFTPEYCPREYPMAPVPMNGICEVFADMFCRANGNCCQRPDEVYETFAACISDQTARCMNPTQTYEFVASLAAGKLDYNSAAMGEQRALLGTMSDQCTPVRFGDAIEMAMEGRVESGGECTATVECVDGYSCREGICALNLSEGETCATHADCASAGLQCLDAACAARVAVGESCAEDDECDSLLCVDGTCADPTDGAFYCVRADVPGPAFER